MKKLFCLFLVFALLLSGCAVLEYQDLDDDRDSQKDKNGLFGDFLNKEDEDKEDDSTEPSFDEDPTIDEEPTAGIEQTVVTDPTLPPEPEVDDTAPTTPNITTSQANALASAKSYLRYSSFSYKGLISQLEFEGYSHEDSVYAVDNCGADWFEQAVKSAESYLKYSSFSYSGLVDQLEYEGFTEDQAKHGADKAYGTGDSSPSGTSVSKQNALASAKSYLKYSAFSYKGLISQLEYEGYSHEDCVYAVDNCGADWFEQAVKSAESYLKYSSFSYSELVSQLEYEGFTNEQAVYGVKQNGL